MTDTKPRAAKVYLVLDEDAKDLKDLLSKGPVWVVDTPRNKERVTQLWDEGLRETGWLTLMTGLPDERLGTRLSMLDEIREHSWNYGSPDVNCVEIVGITHDAECESILAALDWRCAHDTPRGIIVESDYQDKLQATDSLS